MDNFVVSARKYRPASFDAVVGQESITQTLQNAIKNNHLAQAFLFCGPRGVGKTTCARILAKTINLQDHEGEDEDFSFNIFELDAASNNSVDDIRNLTDQVRFAPQVGKYKVYIIDEVHMLSQAAFNAFLKTLEEPPPHAIFILATTEKHKIIPTILSRCQIFDFNRIGIPEMVGHLQEIATQEQVHAETDALHLIAQKADGGMRDALSIFDQLISFSGKELTYKDVITNLNILDYDYYFKVTEAVHAGNIPEVLLILDEILSNGFDAHNFVNGLAEHFRNLLVCQDPSTVKLLEVGETTQQRYAQQASELDPQLLLDGLSILSKCDVQYKSSKNGRLLVEITLMQLSSLSSGNEKKNSTSFGIKPSEARAPSEQNSSGKGAPIVSSNISPAPSTPKPEQKPIKEEDPRDQPTEATPASEATSEERTEAPPETPLETIEESPPKVEASTPVTSEPEKATRPKPKLAAQYQTDTVSISDLMVNEPAKELETKDDGEEPQEAPEASEEKGQYFSQDQLEASWKEYADLIKEHGKESFSSALLSRKPLLEEDNKVVIILDSEHQELELNSEKSDLLNFLRKQLDNSQIQLEHRIVREKSVKKPYTNQEKYDRMTELNPNLKTLRQKLDLDVD